MKYRWGETKTFYIEQEGLRLKTGLFFAFSRFAGRRRGTTVACSNYHGWLLLNPDSRGDLSGPLYELPLALYKVYAIVLCRPPHIHK